MRHRLRHPFWHRMGPKERAFLEAFDRWHERGERNPVARKASKTARRAVDAQRWAARHDVTKHLARATVEPERLALESEGGEARRESPLVRELTARLKALTPGSGRRRAPKPTKEQARLRRILSEIARLS